MEQDSGSRRTVSLRMLVCGVELLGKPFEEFSLRCVQLDARFVQGKERGAIDLGKFTLFAGARRPFDGEGVGAQERQIAIAFCCPRVDNLAGLLADFSEENQQSLGGNRGRKLRCDFGTEFFGEFAPRDFEQSGVT